MEFPALDWTDRILEQMEARLSQIYSRAHKEVGAKWKEYMANAAERIERLQDDYSAAKKSGDKTQIREAGRALANAQQSRTIQNRRYQALTYQLSQDISHVNEIATAYVNGRLPEIYSVNYNEVVENLNGLGGAVGFDLVDPHTIRRLATRDENLLPYKTVNGKKDVRWNVGKINAEVTQGILQGESIPNISKRLGRVLEMNHASAVRNARTSVTSAQNKGRMDMMHYAADHGVILKKGWSAAHDGRTRDWHTELDNGEFIPMDEPFVNDYGEIMYPGDPDADPANVYNCRCALIYEVDRFDWR